MDKKTKYIYTLSTRDTPQNEDKHRLKVKGGKRTFHVSGNEKKNWGSNTYIKQNRLENRGQRDKEGQYLMMKGAVQQRL